MTPLIALIEQHINTLETRAERMEEAIRFKSWKRERWIGKMLAYRNLANELRRILEQTYEAHARITDQKHRDY